MKTMSTWANKLVFLVSVASLIGAAGAFAEDPADKGLAIAQEADRRNTGWVNSSAHIKMILRNAQGEEKIRKLTVKTLEVVNEGDKSLTVFEEPKDVRGTALLSYSHKTEADEQWLYLPALKRVKRIASRNKSGPFMGSEFAFEDMSSQEVEKYHYRFIRREACPDLATVGCFVIERIPIDDLSGYSRQIAWIDQQEYRILKIDFYDRQGAILKTLTNSGFIKYIDKFWRPQESLMENHQTGKSTLLVLDNIEFKTDISENDFSRTSLERIR